MNFSPPLLACHSGRATPSLHAKPTAAKHPRQRFHLRFTRTCPDKPSHLYQPCPLALAEQGWLLLGSPVDQIVICRDDLPARIVAPDRRWFALQKLWLSAQDKRNPLKRQKDRKQALVLLDAVASAMPQYPLDVAF